VIDLSGLNEPQQQAVLHGAGPLVVFAGAGSGKTRVITHRVAHLVADRGVPPWRILAVTFTNKAAGEMRERLGRLVEGAPDLWVGTFHAVCARLLRRYHEACGVRRDFVIYDDSDQKAMVTRILRDQGLDERRYAPKQIAWRINTLKQEGHGPDEFAPVDGFERVVKELYTIYERRLNECGALDFGDLIYRMVTALRHSPELKRELQQRFEHVLVDEFQDTNHVQAELVTQICEQHRNLTVVGDDDQSIYRWRGADRRNILDFRRRFPDAELIKLEQNYRSTRRILAVANSVVHHNADREPKRLWTENEDGAPVTLVCCEDERDEASTVVKALHVLLDAGYARRDMALLYRVHAQSRVFEEALRYANLPYRVVGGLRFYDRAEVKDLLAYLRVVQNPDDDVSLLRIVNTPVRGIGKTTINRLLEAAARSGHSVWQALLDADADPEHGAASRKKLGEFRALLLDLRAQAAAGAGPGVIADAVVERTGYARLLEGDDTAESDARLENLRELLGSILEFERDAQEPTLTAFLELVTLQTDVDRMESDDSMTLMTVHAAKGLEFPVVIVAGLEEETFPHRGFADDDDPGELEEERRLAYVAFTRAEERLFITYAQTRRVYGELRFRRPSRFLYEMPRDELNLVGLSPRGPDARARAGAQRQAAAPARRPAPAHVPGDSYVDRSEVSELGGAELEAGMRVRHGKYGVGQVLSVVDGTQLSAVVRFPGWGDKQIVGRFLEPA
jgi:DNA helicase-2/ATP-dependent DNA helicase PcrA